MCKERHPDLCMTFHLECSNILHYYYDYKASRDHLESAEKMAGMKVSLTGQYKNFKSFVCSVLWITYVQKRKKWRKLSFKHTFIWGAVILTKIIKHIVVSIYM